MSKETSFSTSPISKQKNKLTYEITTGDYGRWWKPSTADSVGCPATPLSHLAKRLSPMRARASTEPLTRVRSPSSVPSAVPFYLKSTHSVSLLAENCRGEVNSPVGDYRFLPVDKEKIGVVGYRGWYTGKKSGKIGTCEAHHRPISQADPEYTLQPSDRDPGSCYLETLPMPYNQQETLTMMSRPDAYNNEKKKNSPIQLSSSPQPQLTNRTTTTTTPRRRQKGSSPSVNPLLEPHDYINIILKETQQKLKRKYPDVFKRHRNISLIFSGRDLYNTSVCNMTDFKHALRLLNIELSDRDFTLVCQEYGHPLDNTRIQCKVFIEAVFEVEREKKPYKLSSLTSSLYLPHQSMYNSIIVEEMN